MAIYIDQVQNFAAQWLADNRPDLHMIKAGVRESGEIYIATLQNGKRHPAVIIPNVCAVERPATQEEIEYGRRRSVMAFLKQHNLPKFNAEILCYDSPMCDILGVKLHDGREFWFDPNTLIDLTDWWLQN